MKNVLLFTLFLSAGTVHSQSITQPVSSGNYWTTNEYKSRLPELANTSTFPATITFPNGSAALNSLTVNRLIGVNQIIWTTGSVQNLNNFVVEWSRDLKTFEQAGEVQLVYTDNGRRYLFEHKFIDNQLVYYRLGIVSQGKVIAHTPAVQVMDEEAITKVFPTLVKGSTFYIQTARPFEKLQVINSANVSVYEKGINGQTGTITIGLPSLSTGIYFVRLLSTNQPQHVQRVLVE